MTEVFVFPQDGNIFVTMCTHTGVWVSFNLD